jgi:ribosomal protein S18 acetylase RimI-like enzyme
MMSDGVVKLRQADFHCDYDAVYELWSQAGPGIHLRRSDEPQEIQKKIARDPDLFIIAEENNQIIGTILGGFDGRRGMMYHLAVAEPYRRQGVARHLVDELERRLRDKGCIRYYLLVTKDNVAAIQFYESLGWKHMDDLYAYGKDIDDTC